MPDGFDYWTRKVRTSGMLAVPDYLAEIAQRKGPLEVELFRGRRLISERWNGEAWEPWTQSDQATLMRKASR